MKVCPRCGGSYSYLKRERRGERMYLYAVHYESGKSRKCYLGPVGEYAYAERLLNLELRGLENVDLAEVAVNALMRLKGSDGVWRVVDVLLGCLDPHGKARLAEKIVEGLSSDDRLSVDERMCLVRRIAEMARYAWMVLDSIKLGGLKGGGETS